MTGNAWWDRVKVFKFLITNYELERSDLTLRVFAVINTVVGIFVYFLLAWLNEGSLEWSGSPFGNWKTAVRFLAGGAITEQFAILSSQFAIADVIDN